MLRILGGYIKVLAQSKLSISRSLKISQVLFMPEIIITSHPTDVSCPLNTSCREGSDKAPLRAGRVVSLPVFKYLSISVICLQVEACVFSSLSHSVILYSWKEKKTSTDDCTVYLRRSIFFFHSFTNSFLCDFKKIFLCLLWVSAVQCGNLVVGHGFSRVSGLSCYHMLA